MRVGVLICFDNNVVENVRATAVLGAQILLARPASVAFEDDRAAADLDLDLIDGSAGQWWTKARRPELCQALTAARSVASR